MAVVIGYAFCYPQTAGAYRAGKVPRSQFKRPKAFDVPHMEELMRDSVERVGVNSLFPERSGLDDLRGSEMLHAVTGVIVRSEMDQERVGTELRRTP